jgi:hypothetical protein
VSTAHAAVIVSNTGTFPDSRVVVLTDDKQPLSQNESVGNPAHSIAFSTFTSGGSNESRISESISDFVFETDIMFPNASANEGFYFNFRV